jgi:hypothetical protein
MPFLQAVKTHFRKNRFNYRQIACEGDLAIFEQSEPEQEQLELFEAAQGERR